MLFLQASKCTKILIMENQMEKNMGSEMDTGLYSDPGSVLPMMH